MKFPQLNELSKTPKGRDTIVRAISQQNHPQSVVEMDITTWKLYHDQFDPAEFDYLRKYGEFEMPAEVRHLPIQRPKVDNLISRQAFRKFPFVAKTVDQESLKRKKNDNFSWVYKQYINQLKDVHYDYLRQVYVLEQQQQQVVQQIQSIGDQDPAAKQQLELITLEIQRVREVIDDMALFDKDKIDKLQKYLKYDRKDFIEEIAQKGLANLRKTLKLKEKSIESLKNYIVNGATYFYVDYLPEQDRLVYEVFPRLKVQHTNVSSSKWTHESDWVCIKDTWSLNDLLSYYKKRLSQDQVEKLKKQFGNDPLKENSNGNFVSIPGHGAVLNDNARGNYVYDSMMHGIAHNRSWWMALREIKAVIKPNKKVPGMSFTHFVEDKVLINRHEYNYNKDKREYVNKKNPKKTYKRNEVYLITPEDDNVEVRYFYERYKGVDIGNGTVTLSSKDDVTVRSVDDYYNVLLPVVGKNFTSISDQPYSLIWSTKDYQKMFNIMNYHKELLLALGGVVVMIMDMSQKPGDMSRDEWFYQLKSGRMLIESKKNYGEVQQFNQWNSMDMTFSANIQYLDLMLDKIEERLTNLMGLTRQSMGQTVPSDQVQTFKQSQANANLTTAIIFEEHDEIERQALTMLLNLAMKYKWNKGALLEVPDNTGTSDLINIPPGVTDKVDAELVAINSIQSEMDIDELKQFALGQAAKGELKFEQFIQMYSMESIKELEKSLEYFSEETRKLEAQANQDLVKAESDAKAQLAQMEQSFKLQLEQEKAKTKMMELELNKILADQQAELKQEDQRIQEQKNESDTALKLLDIMSEHETENRMITENTNNARIDQRLNAISLQMQNIQSALDLKMRGKEMASKEKVELKKAANKPSPQHVNDN